MRGFHRQNRAVPDGVRLTPFLEVQVLIMRRLLGSLSVAVFLSGCSDNSVLDPGALDRALGQREAGADTSTVPGPLPARVRVSGRVVAGTDTTAAEGVAGVQIQFFRNVLDGGNPRQALEADAVSAADGSFATELPGGYYQVVPVVPTASRYRASDQYLAATKSEIQFTILVGVVP